jgi:hypothetical protein
LDGWKKLVAGALIGVAGTIYATDEEARRNLPRAARDLPENVRRRFKGAVSAGRVASSQRRQEILRDLEGHGGGDVSHRPRRDGVEPDLRPESQPESQAEPFSEEPRTPEPAPARLDGATEPIDTREALSREGREGV